MPGSQSSSVCLLAAGRRRVEELRSAVAALQQQLGQAELCLALLEQEDTHRSCCVQKEAAARSAFVVVFRSLLSPPCSAPCASTPRSSTVASSCGAEEEDDPVKVSGGRPTLSKGQRKRQRLKQRRIAQREPLREGEAVKVRTGDTADWLDGTVMALTSGGALVEVPGYGGEWRVWPQVRRAVGPPPQEGGSHHAAAAAVAVAVNATLDGSEDDGPPQLISPRTDAAGSASPRRAPVHTARSPRPVGGGAPHCAAGTAVDEDHDDPIVARGVRGGKHWVKHRSGRLCVAPSLPSDAHRAQQQQQPLCEKGKTPLARHHSPPRDGAPSSGTATHAAAAGVAVARHCRLCRGVIHGQEHHVRHVDGTHTHQRCVERCGFDAAYAAAGRSQRAAAVAPSEAASVYSAAAAGVRMYLQASTRTAAAQAPWRGPREALRGGGAERAAGGGGEEEQL
eukprot:TRINITY_DN27649_c0_g1_i1.p1 TRINITY_DN27649_c0_g1~~TRINITY_DN27649_c0_g1_i1.p1  ORF type:complete len:451 (+),score=90.81 TRINITY_DN27649_c0_g1_i1:71-1423(+)